jgi:hypothetical protein
MPPLNTDSARALLEILGVAVLPGKPAGLDFVVLGGSMAALLGERKSGAEALGEVAAGIRAPVTGKALVGRMGGVMSSTSSRDGRSRMALIPRNPEIPPDMTPGGVITLAASAAGARRGEARDRAAELMEWLGMARLAETPCGKLTEEQRRLAFLGPRSLRFLRFSWCRAGARVSGGTSHRFRHPWLRQGVLFVASRWAKSPGYGNDSLCDESGIRASVRHSQLLRRSGAGRRFRCRSTGASQEGHGADPGVRDLVHREGYYFFNHSDTAYALVQVCNTARANARSIAYLSVAPPAPSALLASFLPPREEPLQDLFGPAES